MDRIKGMGRRHGKLNVWLLTDEFFTSIKTFSGKKEETPLVIGSFYDHHIERLFQVKEKFATGLVNLIVVCFVESATSYLEQGYTIQKSRSFSGKCTLCVQLYLKLV